MEFFEANFSNTSELTKLHHLSNFLGGRYPEPTGPAKPVVAILLLHNMSVKVVKRSLKVCKKAFKGT